MPSPNRDYFGGPVKIVGESFADATPAQPDDEKGVALIAVDLSGLDAVRFKATLGSDYPLGDETQRRKTFAIQPAGEPATTARFITVIEPHEGTSVVRRAEALDADTVRVELADGRVQEITWLNAEGAGGDLAVTFVETKANTVLRREMTQAQLSARVIPAAHP